MSWPFFVAHKKTSFWECQRQAPGPVALLQQLFISGEQNFRFPFEFELLRLDICFLHFPLNGPLNITPSPCQSLSFSQGQ